MYETHVPTRDSDILHAHEPCVEPIGFALYRCVCQNDMELLLDPSLVLRLLFGLEQM